MEMAMVLEDGKLGSRNRPAFENFRITLIQEY
jgi:hypothetical protein